MKFASAAAFAPSPTPGQVSFGSPSFVSVVSPLGVVNQSPSPRRPLGDSNDTALPSGGWGWEEA